MDYKYLYLALKINLMETLPYKEWEKAKDFIRRLETDEMNKNKEKITTMKLINLGTKPNDGDGDTFQEFIGKCNHNFKYIQSKINNNLELKEIVWDGIEDTRDCAIDINSNFVKIESKTPIDFLNYVFENHYFLYNVTKGKHIYRDVDGNLIEDKDLYEKFKKENER